MLRRTLLSVLLLAATAMAGTLHVTAASVEPPTAAALDADRPAQERAVASVHRDERGERSPSRAGPFLLVAVLIAAGVAAGRRLRTTPDGLVPRARVWGSTGLGQRAPPSVQASVA